MSGHTPWGEVKTGPARERVVDLMMQTLREAAEPVGTMREDCRLLLRALLSDEGRPLLLELLRQTSLNVFSLDWMTDEQRVALLKERGVLYPFVRIHDVLWEIRLPGGKS